MSTSSQDRLVYIEESGAPKCVSARAIATIPAEFDEVVKTLSYDLTFALDCIDLFGGVPVPVAKAILRNIEPVRAAIDLAIQNAAAGEKATR